MEVLVGIVKWFSATKRYGFLFRDGAEIFFHWNDRARVEEGQDIPEFVHFAFRNDYFPKSGDSIVFITGRDWQGRPKAHPWAFADEYVNILKSMSSVARDRADKATELVSRITLESVRQARKIFEESAKNQRQSAPPPKTPASKSARDRRLDAIVKLIHGGKTDGEREAARAAYKRIVGHEYRIS